MTSTAVPDKILVVDDDHAILLLISRFLQSHNYQVETADTAAIAREKFTRFKPDLVILDVNLPDGNGFNLCQEMRSVRTLVMMLTCLRDRNHILEGFEQGADAYLTKPLDLPVFHAKIRALLNRHLPVVEFPVASTFTQALITIGNLTINGDRCEVTRKGNLVPLTLLEYQLLYFLATHPEKVWSRQELITSVWQNQLGETVERKVDVHIGQIRRKIGSPENQCIRTIRGKGYVFQHAPTGQD
ncbi:MULTISPECIES: response regulator transcription factor [unclassified Synechocystis]|uniref:response regulator transcription factor n=1 Tax=unclassified Synechocystis TaxID=2640012 RepID=UPI00042896F0|nr:MULTISPECIES: response regulator transcription factor [unclassified Synechocystis]AIE74631.1 two-component response regulator [Synechocystis sp. PCC 6714]MCT0254010.1 response regulator transcription factor [Synechocystis sp. CS-94]